MAFDSTGHRRQKLVPKSRNLPLSHCHGGLTRLNVTKAKHCSRRLRCSGHERAISRQTEWVRTAKGEGCERALFSIGMTGMSVHETSYRCFTFSHFFRRVPIACCTALSRNQNKTSCKRQKGDAESDPTRKVRLPCARTVYRDDTVPGARHTGRPELGPDRGVSAIQSLVHEAYSWGRPINTCSPNHDEPGGVRQRLCQRQDLGGGQSDTRGGNVCAARLLAAHLVSLSLDLFLSFSWLARPA